MSEIDLYLKLRSLPENLRKEVAGFIDSLIHKTAKRQPPKKTRPAGLARGLIAMKPGFDQPLEDFKEYM